jgi:tetratricopeptide (TPR) repeat protein
MTRRWLWVVPLLCAAAAYSIAPWGELVWDDQLLVKQQLPAFRHLGDVLVPPANIPQWTYAYYRPIVVLSYVLDQALFGRGSARGPHASNVAYHLLATGFVWLLAQRVLRNLPSGTWGALVAATLFAVHPIHTESVSWVTGRSDVLATLFLLPALLTILRWRDRGSITSLLAAPVLLLGALLAKEVALTGLVLAPMLLLLAPADLTPPGRAPVAGGRAIVGTWAAAAIACLGAAGLYWLLRRGAGTSGASLQSGTPAEVAEAALRALGFYLSRLLWPWPQSNFVTWDLAPGVVLSAWITLSALAAGVLAWRAWRRAGVAAGFIGILWIGMSLPPALAVALTAVAAAPLAERYLYLPSVGLAVVIGAAFSWVHGRGYHRAATAVAAIVLLLAGAATLLRGQVWLSDLRLWSDALRQSGDHAAVLIEFGKAQFQAGNVVAADDAFRRAMGVADTPRLRATAAYNAGAMALTQGRIPEAGRLFSAAIGFDPDYALGHYGLGRFEYEEGLRAARSSDRSRAMALFDSALRRHESALRLSPTHTSAHLESARVLASAASMRQIDGDTGRAADDYRAAVAHVEAALALEPAVLSRPEVQELQRRVVLGLRGATRNVDSSDARPSAPRRQDGSP